MPVMIESANISQTLTPEKSCCASQIENPDLVAPSPDSERACCSSAPKTPTAEPRWQAYIPILVILGISASVAGALQFVITNPRGPVFSLMTSFMGTFLVIFSMFKFFDLKGFARGFARYDLAAKNFEIYGFLYPFLELGLGLALLANWNLKVTCTMLAILMFFGAAGVLRALGSGAQLKCACLGSTLNVPLSTVALVEDLGMGVMALVMLGMLG